MELNLDVLRAYLPALVAAAEDDNAAAAAWLLERILRDCGHEEGINDSAGIDTHGVDSYLLS